MPNIGSQPPAMVAADVIVDVATMVLFEDELAAGGQVGGSLLNISVNLVCKASGCCKIIA